MIHWLGLGLSSAPGVRYLSSKGYPLAVWNRTLDKARETLDVLSLGAVTPKLGRFELSTLYATIEPGDIVVSMLPATQHPEIAEVCVERRAHLVTTSYLSPAMLALQLPASERDLCFINEAGLDPGLDHLAAFELIDEAKRRPQASRIAAFEFDSHCGGFPLHPGKFRYQFSWSPAGVLRALRSPATWIENGAIQESTPAWKSLRPYSVGGQSFEMYPNRDSAKYLDFYGFPSHWKPRRLIRGTLRPQGWKTAWADILGGLNAHDDASLEELADSLWKKHHYRQGQLDRVVLSVALTCRDSTGDAVYSGQRILDLSGEVPLESAMARTVALNACVAVESILNGEARPGVQAVPEDAVSRDRWLASLARLGIAFRG